ncbi:hypothetical protein BUALT_Bualt02G0117400 [Buddleja alternifolia]|uniref:Phytocyanin domain-containing protein n=1 Tax=Buddleja alternifolia TaxID=168488 RepID=A0AAV6Y7G6_9LAMI|nr:hypothetical protein BUALT_Bualt02G0117400 [Buddleja alternifolia]
MAATSFLCSCFTTLCFILLISATSGQAVRGTGEFKVGGSDQGWRQPAANETEMYALWAATKTFYVGNSLRFEYKNDSVEVVAKWGYYHCDSSRPISVYKDGNTVINLDKPGPIYFISADPDHCKNGQRLMVEVMTLHSITHSPPVSGAGSVWVEPGLVFFYGALLLASIM